MPAPCGPSGAAPWTPLRRDPERHPRPLTSTHRAGRGSAVTPEGAGTLPSALCPLLWGSSALRGVPETSGGWAGARPHGPGDKAPGASSPPGTPPGGACGAPPFALVPGEPGRPQTRVWLPDSPALGCPDHVTPGLRDAAPRVPSPEPQAVTAAPTHLWYQFTRISSVKYFMEHCSRMPSGVQRIFRAEADAPADGGTAGGAQPEWPVPLRAPAQDTAGGRTVAPGSPTASAFPRHGGATARGAREETASLTADAAHGQNHVFVHCGGGGSGQHRRPGREPHLHERSRRHRGP